MWVRSPTLLEKVDVDEYISDMTRTLSIPKWFWLRHDVQHICVKVGTLDSMWMIIRTSVMIQKWYQSRWLLKELTPCAESLPDNNDQTMFPVDAATSEV